MKSPALKEDFIKVWLGDLPESEKKDAIRALEKLLVAVCDDMKEITNALLNIVII
jgi:hypothetical protein